MSEERLALAALTRCHKPGDPRVLEVIAKAGALAALASVCEASGADPREALRRADADLAAAESIGARLVVPADPEWPSPVDALWRARGAHRPYALWVRGQGDLVQLCARAVAIVGSRDCSEYGRHVTKDLAYDLAERGWSIVSGAAFGIDAEAHRGALLAQGSTIAVLACGVDVAYPAAHTHLLERILDHGCLVSEEPPGAGVRRDKFLNRNRLIAALSSATVLVEAGVRSGALSTTMHAAQIGRQVLVVPGPVTGSRSAGSNELIRTGTGVQVVLRADHVLEALGPLEVMELPYDERTARDRLPAAAASLLEHFPTRQGVSPAELAELSAMTTAEVVALLELLLSAGFVEITESGFCLSDLARSPSGGAPS